MNETASQYHPSPHVHQCPDLQFQGGSRFLHKAHEWRCWRPRCKDSLDEYPCGFIADRAGFAQQIAVDLSLYISISKAAGIACYSVRQFRRIANKELEPFAIGTRYFILRTKFEDWLTKRGNSSDQQAAC